MAKRKAASSNKTNGKASKSPPSSLNRESKNHGIILKAISITSILIVFAAIYLANQRALSDDNLLPSDPTFAQSDNSESRQPSAGAQRLQQSSDDGLERITVPTQDGQKQFLDPVQFGTMWNMNEYFSKDYDFNGLHDQLKTLFDYSERAYDPSSRLLAVQPAFKERGGGFDRTTRHKLIHDIEQFEYYLRSKDVTMASHGLQLFGTYLPALYRQALSNLDQSASQGEFEEESQYYIFQQNDVEMFHYYNRAMFLPTLPEVERPLLTGRDWNQVEREWFGEDEKREHPGIVVVDDILSPQTLDRVRKYLLLSTFWYEAKLPRFGKYLGAYINDGMYDTMMAEIAFDLHKAMPRVMKGHHLKETWAYKYESSSDEDEKRAGIHVHADDAMVNVNLWITPDDANLDPNSGGLVIYTVKPPREWSFNNFNANWEYIDENLLRPSGYANVTVPYRQNRAVIFDSFLFHKSDFHRFKQGYENRRINLTFLYGNNQSTGA